ncbi:hypothetical protein Tco_0792823 [Tanacetum coccineum]
MTTLADKSLLLGGDNKPPMLEKHLYDSWKSIMELYMMIASCRNVLAFVEKGPLAWPSIIVDGVTRLKEYTELTPAEGHFKLIVTSKQLISFSKAFTTEIFNALVVKHLVSKDLCCHPSIIPLPRIRLRKNLLTLGKHAPSINGRVSIHINSGEIKLFLLRWYFKDLTTSGACGSNSGKIGGRLFAITAKGQGHNEPDSEPNQREKGMIRDPDIPEGQSTQTVITHNAAYQAD